MRVIIAWDGDHIGREVGRASLADNVERLRQISQAIDQGNQIWKSWVEMSGGSIISFGGDEGRAEIPADKLEELPKIRVQYGDAVGSSVSVGVGVKLSEADKALMVSKFRGGDRITLYSEEIEAEIEKAQAKPQSEVDKLAEEYLNKAELQKMAKLNYDTPEFQSWFQGSHVAHPDGRPMVVYHGTSKDADFSSFRAGKRGIWFTSDPKSASDYAQNNDSGYGYDFYERRATNDKARVFPVHLSMKNPYKYTPADHEQMRAADGRGESHRKRHEADLMSRAQQAGHDGVDFGNGVYVAFHPHQVKSVFNNTPNPKQKNILKAEPALAQGAGAGMSGAMQPQAPTVARPRVEASEHSQGEAAQSLAEDAPASPEATHAEADLEEMLHQEAQAAQEREAQEQGQEQEPDHGPSTQVKAQIVAILQKIRSAGPALEQMQQTNPEVYEAIMALTQGVVAMARQVPSDAQQGLTSVAEISARAETKKSENPLEDEPEGVDKDALVEGARIEYENTKDLKQAIEIALHNLTQDPSHYKKLGQAQEKADKARDKAEVDQLAGLAKEGLSFAVGTGNLPEAKAPHKRHHVVLPVGSKKDSGPQGKPDNAGKIKVQHHDGKTTWIQARAGQIMSADGHPISSRNPSGK